MPNEHDTRAVTRSCATGRDEMRPAPVAALAFELRQAGIAPQGLGFALRTLGPDRVIEELRTRARFGARCQRRGAVASDPDERAAWTILAASGPRAIERRLERDGLIRRPRLRPRAGRVSGHAATGADASVALLRGRAEFGRPADRTPFQEQLAEVALALTEAT
jgi:hypothetical protein